MVVHFIIEEFGKVKSADIALSNLVLFVGNNNSGKTMIMQLVYGLRKKLREIPVPPSKKYSEMLGQSLIRFEQSWYEELVEYLNRYLMAHKEEIVEAVFGSSVSIGKLAIALEGTDETSYVCSVSEIGSGEIGEKYDGTSIDILRYENGESRQIAVEVIPGIKTEEEAAHKVSGLVWEIILLEGAALDSEQLFLPAARSGLQLLHKQYFATGMKGNLVQPVRDFMCFLQLYSERKREDAKREELLKFGEKKLLHGRLKQVGEETFYVEQGADMSTPLYISSSMIHELTPFVKALMSDKKISWLYCDEIENSLHPLLQGEMARWIIRMANVGMHVIVSSHSDTMAGRLNNLLILSRCQQKTRNLEQLKALKLDPADLLNADIDASIYEFKVENGQTTVEKLEFIESPLVGYDFQLFSKNLDKLYEEAERITR
jgi:hypothetical protein